LVESDELKEI